MALRPGRLPWLEHGRRRVRGARPRGRLLRRPGALGPGPQRPKGLDAPEGGPKIDLLTTFVGLPADALKAIVTVAVGGLLAGGTYVLARIKEARRPPEQAAGLPRVALDPVDRDLAFTLVRTGTDLTRALNEHGEILRASLPPGGGAAAQHDRAPRTTRTRRH
ncbi:MAG: hypothetical protein INR63_06685 [Actinomycetospora chiangmaiensis]|nr:hypothetical protein [Actinomycetospora chiangmaiensis]